MDIFGTLILALARVIDLAITIYIFIVIARALISWVNPDPYNPIVRFLHVATDPVLYQIRRFVPMQFGGFDFTPIVLLLALSFLQQILQSFLYSLAAGL